MSPAQAALEARYAEAFGRDNPSALPNQPVAGGATHQSWYVEPHGVVFDVGKGVYKWDVLGRKYLDFWMGHGSLMFGNAHDAVVEAVTRQASRGQHLGGAHRLHYEWAERIRQYFPFCSQIRFAGSGTEATMLAFRIARAYTGRSRVIRIDGNFHGWHDDALAHLVPYRSAGLNPGSGEYVSVLPPLDIATVQDELAEGDVAAVILEPGGGSSGCLPWSVEYLAALREVTALHGALLIFDEIVSGFRYSKGGVAALSGVVPDIITLAKIACGGMPGGLVGGGVGPMSVFNSVRQPGAAKVVHSGTFNGSLLSAAAALATLDLMAHGDACRSAEQQAGKLVQAVNEAAAETEVAVSAFHQSSIFHLVIGATPGTGEGVQEPGIAAVRLLHQHPGRYALLRKALLLEGVDCHASHGWVSAVHDDGHIEQAAQAFKSAFRALRGIPGFQRESAPMPTASGGCGHGCTNALCSARFRTIANCSLPLVDDVAVAAGGTAK